MSKSNTLSAGRSSTSPTTSSPRPRGYDRREALLELVIRRAQRSLAAYIERLELDCQTDGLFSAHLARCRALQ
jgi:hypothetical protein